MSESPGTKKDDNVESKLRDLLLEENKGVVPRPKKGETLDDYVKNELSKYTLGDAALTMDNIQDIPAYNELKEDENFQKLTSPAPEEGSDKPPSPVDKVEKVEKVEAPPTSTMVKEVLPTEPVAPVPSDTPLEGDDDTTLKIPTPTVAKSADINLKFSSHPLIVPVSPEGPLQVMTNPNKDLIRVGGYDFIKGKEWQKFIARYLQRFVPMGTVSHSSTYDDDNFVTNHCVTPITPIAKRRLYSTNTVRYENNITAGGTIMLSHFPSQYLTDTILGGQVAPNAGARLYRTFKAGHTYSHLIPAFRLSYLEKMLSINKSGMFYLEEINEQSSTRPETTFLNNYVNQAPEFTKFLRLMPRYEETQLFGADVRAVRMRALHMPPRDASRWFQPYLDLAKYDFGEELRKVSIEKALNQMSFAPSSLFFGVTAKQTARDSENLSRTDNATAATFAKQLGAYCLGGNNRVLDINFNDVIVKDAAKHVRCDAAAATLILVNWSMLEKDTLLKLFSLLMSGFMPALSANSAAAEIGGNGLNFQFNMIPRAPFSSEGMRNQVVGWLNRCQAKHQGYVNMRIGRGERFYSYSGEYMPILPFESRQLADRRNAGMRLFEKERKDEYLLCVDSANQMQQQFADWITMLNGERRARNVEREFRGYETAMKQRLQYSEAFAMSQGKINHHIRVGHNVMECIPPYNQHHRSNETIDLPLMGALSFMQYGIAIDESKSANFMSVTEIGHPTYAPMCLEFINRVYNDFINALGLSRQNSPITAEHRVKIITNAETIIPHVVFEIYDRYFDKKPPGAEGLMHELVKRFKNAPGNAQYITTNANVANADGLGDLKYNEHQENTPRLTEANDGAVTSILAEKSYHCTQAPVFFYMNGFASEFKIRNANPTYGKVLQSGDPERQFVTVYEPKELPQVGYDPMLANMLAEVVQDEEDFNMRDVIESNYNQLVAMLKAGWNDATDEELDKIEKSMEMVRNNGNPDYIDVELLVDQSDDIYTLGVNTNGFTYRKAKNLLNGNVAYTKDEDYLGTATGQHLIDLFHAYRVSHPGCNSIKAIRIKSDPGYKTDYRFKEVTDADRTKLLDMPMVTAVRKANTTKIIYLLKDEAFDVYYATQHSLRSMPSNFVPRLAATHQAKENAAGRIVFNDAELNNGTASVIRHLLLPVHSPMLNFGVTSTAGTINFVDYVGTSYVQKVRVGYNQSEKVEEATLALVDKISSLSVSTV